MPKQPSARGRGIDVGSLARKHPEPDFALHQVVDRVDEMAEVAAKPVELPNDQRVALAQRLEARFQTGAIILFARGLILIEAGRLHTGRDQRIALEVEDLRPVRLRHPHVADQHISPDCVTTVFAASRPSKSIIQLVTLSMVDKGWCQLIRGQS